jgi:uncharacterized metal-binding protein YceD (DUF177 family)
VSKVLPEFVISFVGLPVGIHDYSYVLTDEFTQHFPEQEFEKLRGQAELKLEKKHNSSMELWLSIDAIVEVRCDRTDRPFDMPLKSSRHLVVQFGDEFNDDDDELLIIPNGEYELKTAHLFYELIVQSLPLKRLYPGLEEDDTEIYTTIESEKKPDPRWAGLKNIKQSSEAE